VKLTNKLVGIVVESFVRFIEAVGNPEALTDRGPELAICRVTAVDAELILTPNTRFVKAYLPILLRPVILIANQVCAGKNLVKFVATTIFLGLQI